MKSTLCLGAADRWGSRGAKMRSWIKTILRLRITQEMPWWTYSCFHYQLYSLQEGRTRQNAISFLVTFCIRTKPWYSSVLSLNIHLFIEKGKFLYYSPSLSVSLSLSFQIKIASIMLVSEFLPEKEVEVIVSSWKALTKWCVPAKYISLKNVVIDSIFLHLSKIQWMALTLLPEGSSEGGTTMTRSGGRSQSNGKGHSKVQDLLWDKKGWDERW